MIKTDNIIIIYLTTKAKMAQLSEKSRHSLEHIASMVNKQKIRELTINDCIPTIERLVGLMVSENKREQYISLTDFLDEMELSGIKCQCSHPEAFSQELLKVLHDFNIQARLGRPCHPDRRVTFLQWGVVIHR